LENYILAVDIGTTSTKGLAVSHDGSVLTHFQKAYPTHRPEPGFAEQDPEQILKAVHEVISAVIHGAGDHRVAGIAFSSAMHSIMVVDGKGNPLSSLIIWADTRSTAQSQRLKNSETGKLLYKLSGTPVHPMSPLCKLLWMKEKQPGLFSAASKFISIKEFVLYHLCGEYVIDYSVASATGLFDTRSRQWGTEALNLLGISPEKLSKPVSPFTKLIMKSNLLPGIPEIPVIVGASDGCLAQLGSGAMDLGDLSITIGTSGAVRMVSSAPIADPKSRLFQYILDEKTLIAGGATNNGAILLSWFSESMEGIDSGSEAFIKEAFTVADAEGLIFLPYVMGERAPMYEPEAKGVFFGIGIHHRRAHFKRAILEGICLGLKNIIIAVEEVVHKTERIFASGGFIQSAAWVQLMADVIGKPVQASTNSDASAWGAAIQGFQAIGQPFHRASEKGLVFEPDMAKNEYYKNLFHIFESLNAKLLDEFPKITALQSQFISGYLKNP
jgi:gluconokinase